MKNIKKSIQYIVFGVVAVLIAMFAVVAVVPERTNAFDFGQLIDPLCLFACDDDTNPIQQIVDPFCVFACDDNDNSSNNNVPNPNASIDANPLSVNYNGSSTIYWNSSNATSCTGSGGTNGWSGNKSASGNFYTGPLTNTVTYYISCSNSRGSANDSVTVHVDDQVQNPTVNISANPSNVDFNESSVISWNSNNATSCFASSGTNGWAGNKNTSGTFYTGNLTNDATFYISCTNSTGSANDSVTVQVGNDNNDNDDVSVNITADDTSIDFEDSTRIRWDSDNADYCTPSDGTNDWEDEDINTSGSFNTGSLTDDETFRITCYNNGDSANDSVTIRVDNDDDNNGDEPDVTTRSATNIGNGSATLNGRVDGNGSSVRAWFEYGTNSSLGYTTSTNSYSSGERNFERSISGLIPNTTYYFRAVAENSEDTVYGSILSFYTTGGSVIVNNQPTVVIYADLTSIAYSAATTVRWSTTNTTSCFASGGSAGWAGAKEAGSGSFYTGVLTSSRTFSITCSNNVGSSTDSVTVNVRGQVLGATTTVVRSTPLPTSLTSLVLVNSSIDNNKPRAGEEINYIINYQNLGTGSITDLILQVALPEEVSYMFTSGGNLNIFGNTLVFRMGTLRANEQGAMTIRVKVRDDVSSGTSFNFPAILSYTDPSGAQKTVNADASAQVWGEELNSDLLLGANVFGAGYLPTNIFGWLLLFILIMIMVVLAKYLFGSDQSFPFRKKTVTTYDDHHPFEKKTTTTTLHE